MPRVRSGKAVRWNEERGFGFIECDDGGPDIFIHRSALGESRDLRLHEGDRVEFEEIRDRHDKICAGNVEIIESSGGGGGGGRGRGRRDDSRAPKRRRGRSESRSRSRGRGGDGPDQEEIQKLVEERQEARKARDFEKSDALRDKLKDMDVHVDDTELTWRGPDGMRGSHGDKDGRGGGAPNKGKGSGKDRKPGDWDCGECGRMNFARREECFSCGAPKREDRGRGGRGGDRDRGGGRDRYDDRDRGGRRDDRRSRRDSRDRGRRDDSRRRR